LTVSYRNFKDQDYFLHKKLTKKGNNKYYFSTKSEGDLVDKLPPGFEIYENPNGQVFLRKIRPSLITDKEKEIVISGMKEYSKVNNFKIDIKKDIITIYTSDQDLEELSKFLEWVPRKLNVEDKKILINQIVHYSPVLRFRLIEKTKRYFTTERYCFLGSINDWIEIGNIDKLEKLIRKYVRHLGQESFYDLI